MSAEYAIANATAFSESGEGSFFKSRGEVELFTEGILIWWV